MKLLLRAALRVHRHLILFVVTLMTMIGLTIASQTEMLTIGVLTNTGTEILSGNEVAPALKDVGKNPLDWVMQEFAHRLNLGKSMQVLIALLCFVALFKAFFLFFSRYTTQLLSIRICRDLRQQYFDHIQHQPMSFFQKYNIGTLSSRVVGDANQIASSINSFLINYIQAPFTILSTLGACFWISWQLSLVIFFGLPMIAIPVIFVTRKVKKITRQLQRNQERFATVLIDFLAGIQTVKVFAMEAFSLKKYREQNEMMAKLEKKTAKYDLLTRPVLHTITTACLATVLIVGLHLLKMQVSELVAFVGFLHLFYEPVKKFADENANIQKGVVAAERMYEVLNLKPHIVDAPGAIELKGFEKGLEFEDVWFKYEDRWILKGLSFSVQKGETVALVGATGAGKSTVVQLIPRLYDIQKGTIRIDGLPLEAYTQKSLREQISFVPQKPFLFYDTIAANISYGNPFTREAIVKAAKKAHADEFIQELPKTYDTMLAETGKNFSGGQQQRLAIARALVKGAPLLILDEATSSLDAISENNIKMAIKELHGEITQILIAHRLSTIEYADRIIYLEDGEKLAEGTKEELLASCTPFKLLWETHFRTHKMASVD